MAYRKKNCITIFFQPEIAGRSSSDDFVLRGGDAFGSSVYSGASEAKCIASANDQPTARELSSDAPAKDAKRSGSDAPRITRISSKLEEGVQS